jgi:hypothetical protein
MYERWSAKISRAVGAFLLLICIMTYALSLLRRDLAEVVSTALAAIGILAALSAICFSFSPCITEIEDRHKANYAGEKFLQCCVMIIQTLFAKYAYSSAISFDMVKNTAWLSYASDVVFTVLVVAFSAFAVYSAYWGFDELNKLLWDRYERRRAATK